MPNPQPGTILGAYRVEGTIGSGSMGEVFRAVDTGLNRRVAIKILSEKHRDSPELRARFVREGRAVAAISHPNVVQVFATGIYDERPYIAMELLDGTDLGSTVEKHGPMDSTAATHAILDAAQGLAAAAKAGLIHRDVKPSNLVRLTDGRVKVTDFGLAKPVDPGAEPALTAMGVVVGTPDYIAPEQARGEAIDERVDIYALGGTLYYVLTGIPPFRTGKPAEDKYLKVVARHLRNPAPDAATTNPRVDKDLSALARAMMAKKAPERPTYEDLVGQLGGILTRLDPDAVPVLITGRERSRPNIMVPSARIPTGGIPATKPGLAPMPRQSAGPQLAPVAYDVSPTASELVPPARSLPIWIVALTLACIALFVAGLVVYLRRPDVAEAAGQVETPLKKELATADMLLVRKADGSPWFYTAKQPLSAASYREFFKTHSQSGAPDDPVVGVSYTQATSYVLSNGGRLLTAAEWTAAATNPTFVMPAGRFEWVDSPDAKARTALARSGPQVRPDDGHADVTFRVARDL